VEEAHTMLCKGNFPVNIDFQLGTIMLINKPLGWTSFDVVNRVKYAIKHNHGLKKIKVGHGGTLDPMADGLIIVCTGKYTKLLEHLSNENKSYTATFKIGCTTPCYDREAEEENHIDSTHITKEVIENSKQKFLGKINQIPPIFSAIKIKGKNAYTLARRGADIELKSREVEVYNFEISDISLPFIKCDLTVSKGTYIRSIANDFGKEIGVGAYLYGLTRTSINQHQLQNALEIDEVINYIKQNV
jgi:tRNA pseudouridine55 synthase